MIAKRKIEHLSEENILINSAILKQLKDNNKIQPTPPSRDETLQSLKSEIEMIISSGKNYSYKSPQEVFEDQLMKEFQKDSTAPPFIRSAVGKLRVRDPLIFSVGKHHLMNYEALAEARDMVRENLKEERLRKEEEERIEREEKERKRQERIRIAQEKKAKRRPWSKSPQKEEKKYPWEVNNFVSPVSTFTSQTPIVLPPRQSSIF